MDQLLESAEVFLITHVKSNHPTLDSPFQASKFDNVRDYGFLPIRTTKKTNRFLFCANFAVFRSPLVFTFSYSHTTDLYLWNGNHNCTNYWECGEQEGAIMEWTRWSINHHGVIINNRQQKRCAKSSECPPFSSICQQLSTSFAFYFSALVLTVYVLP